MDSKENERETQINKKETLIAKTRSWRQGDANDGEWLKALSEGPDQAAGRVHP